MADAAVKRYVTPRFVLSFPHLFEKNKFGDNAGDGKYTCSAVFRPSDFNDKEKKLWKELMAGLDGICMERFKKKWKDLPPNVKRGLRDGAEKAELAGYGEGTVFATLSTLMRPGVVDAGRNKIAPEEGNAEEVYPGCVCRATVTIYAYDNKSKGVALGLMNIQKVADGDRLDSRTDAEDDFNDDFLDGVVEVEGEVTNPFDS